MFAREAVGSFTYRHRAIGAPTHENTDSRLSLKVANNVWKTVKRFFIIKYQLFSAEFPQDSSTEKSWYLTTVLFKEFRRGCCLSIELGVWLQLL